MSRARSVEIYLKPGVETDDQVHEVWMSLRGRGRPQDTFRRALRAGLMDMAERGELPRSVMESAMFESVRPLRAARKAAPERRARAEPPEAAPTPAAPPPAAPVPVRAAVPPVPATVREVSAPTGPVKRLGGLM